MKRIAGLFRDAWWLLLVIVGGSIFLWAFLKSVAVGVVCLLLGLVTFVYFAVVRYDSDGNERSSDMS